MKRTVEVTQSVSVEIDPGKFTPEFMAEFRETIAPFSSLQDHIEHLGQLYARGLADDYQFIEGYGPAEEMGIKFSTLALVMNTVHEDTHP